MTNCTKLIGTTTALILAAGACADLQYGEAILSAESNCFSGSEHDLVEEKITYNGTYEANSSCGGGMTSAYLHTDDAWFILSAGSSVPGQNGNSNDKDGRIVVDGGNGAAAVEVQFTVDRPTLFRMSRCLEGSNVRFWDGEYQIAELGHADQVTQLRAGTYWATIETDQYGSAVWAEIDWQQSDADDPADINGDGKVNHLDLADMITLLSDNNARKPGLDKEKGKGLGDVTPMPKPKPAQKPGLKPARKPDLKPGQKPGRKPGERCGTGSSTKGDQFRSMQSFDRNSQPGQYGPQLSDNGADRYQDKPSNDKVDIEDPSRTSKKSRTKGDLDRDGKVDIKDIVILMGRL